MLTSSGSTGGVVRGGDAKTIISPNTSFGGIIKQITAHPCIYYSRHTAQKQQHNTSAHRVINPFSIFLHSLINILVIDIPQHLRPALVSTFSDCLVINISPHIRPAVGNVPQ